MRLLRVGWRLMCTLAVLIGLGVVALVFYFSSAQHKISDAFGSCPSGTVHDYAVVGPGGSVETFGDSNVAFSLKSTSGLRSAGVTLTPKSNLVVKRAAIYSDAAGAHQLGAAKGTYVSSVRVGQTNRSAQVLRADACVGKAGIFGRFLSVAHFIGKVFAISMLIFIVLVLGAGFELGRWHYHRSNRHEIASV